MRTVATASRSRTGRESSLPSETIDEAMQRAAEVLSFAAADWENRDGTRGIPRSRTIHELRDDPGFRDDAVDAVIAAVPFRAKAEAAE